MLPTEEPLTNQLISVTKRYLSLLSDATRDLDIDRYHYVIVLIADHEEQLSQKALTDLLEIDKSYTVTIVDYLSAHGYVTREKNLSDKREQVLKLTEKAKNTLPQLRKSIGELNKQSFKSLTPEEVKLFNNVLNVIRENLSNTLYPDTHIKSKQSLTKS